MYNLASFLMVSSPSSLSSGNPIYVGTENSDDMVSLCSFSPICSDQAAHCADIPWTETASHVGAGQMSVLSLPNISGRDDWKCVNDMFQKDPSKLSNAFLTMTLKRRPSVSLVKSMLNINPDAASIPKHGPSALQVAVQRNCSIEVITELITVCPFALIATNPGTNDDPLSYAKRFRSDEVELIELLSHPVHHWFSMKNNSVKDESTSLKYSYGPMPLLPLKKITLDPAEKVAELTHVTSLPTHAHDAVGEMITLNSFETMSSCSNIDEMELKNLKLICLTVLKKHKFLCKEVQSLRKELHDVTTNPRSETANMIQEERLQELQLTIEQQSHDYDLALEKVELENQRNVLDLQDRLNEVLHRFEVNFENAFESRMNTISACFHFRLQYLTQRVEQMESQVQNVLKTTVKKSRRHGSTPLDIGGVRFSHHENTENFTIETFTSSTNADTTPIVFATPWRQADDDDAQSLLTEDVLFDRRRKWRPLAA